MAGVAPCSRQLWRLPWRLAVPRVTTTATTASRVATVTGCTAATRRAGAAPFSTTAGRPAPPVKKASGRAVTGKKIQMAKKKKKKSDFFSGKAPAPGERKAVRKRIVLSNSNALEVAGLAELGAGTAADAAAAGRMFALPDGLVDRLRTVEAFKATQSFPLFRRPSLLVRRETVELARRLEAAAATGGTATPETLRLVIDGERGAGKSTLLQQAMAYGFLNDWLVLNIPEAQELTTGATEYAPLATDPVLYSQPVYAHKLLQTFRAANAAVLERFSTARAYAGLQNPVAAGATLAELVAAATEPENAWPVFQAVWQELLLVDKDGQPLAAEAGKDRPARPPLLVTLDGLSHVMRMSAYRSPAFELIHAHDLALVRSVVDVLAGVRQLPGGGAVVAATSGGNSPKNPTMDLALALAGTARREATAEAQTAALATAAEAPGPVQTARLAATNPYYKGYDARTAAALQAVQVMRVGGASRAETRALLEYWAASGIVRERVDEQMVAGTWTVAGNGVVGELERVALHSLRA